MSNPFAALAGSDSEDDGSAPVTKAPAKAAPAKKAVKGPTKSVPAAESNYRGGGGDYAARGDTRATSGRGRGNDGGRGRGGNGGRGGRGSGDAKRSQGKAGNKADEKRQGQGGGNYGSTADDIAAGKAEVEAGAEPRTPKSPAPRDDEPEPEPELPTFTMEEYLAKQSKSSKVGALKLRKAGEGEKSAVKQGDVILKTDLADVESYGGNDKYGGKTKKADATRKGRSANANRLLVDIKYAPSDQVESSYAPERAPRGGGRGGGPAARVAAVAVAPAVARAVAVAAVVAARAVVVAVAVARAAAAVVADRATTPAAAAASVVAAAPAAAAAAAASRLTTSRVSKRFDRFTTTPSEA